MLFSESVWCGAVRGALPELALLEFADGSDVVQLPQERLLELLRRQAEMFGEVRRQAAEEGEMPFQQWTDAELDVVTRLCITLGYQVILAHLERFLPLQKNRPFLQKYYYSNF